MQFPYKSIQTAYYYKENPPSAHLETKTSQVYRKNALPRPQVKENLYLIIFWSSHLYRGLPAYTLLIYLQGVML